MNGNDEFKAGQERGEVLGELKSINQRLTTIESSFSDFKIGIGQKVGDHDTTLTELKTKTNIIMTVATWILAPAFGVIVTTLLYLIIKK